MLRIFLLLIVNLHSPIKINFAYAFNWFYWFFLFLYVLLLAVFIDYACFIYKHDIYTRIHVIYAHIDMYIKSLFSLCLHIIDVLETRVLVRTAWMVVLNRPVNYSDNIVIIWGMFLFVLILVLFTSWSCLGISSLAVRSAACFRCYLYKTSKSRFSMTASHIGR